MYYLRGASLFVYLFTFSLFFHQISGPKADMPVSLAAQPHRLLLVVPSAGHCQNFNTVQRVLNISTSKEALSRV